MRLWTRHRQGLEIYPVQRPVRDDNDMCPGWNPWKNRRDEQLVETTAGGVCAGEGVRERVVEGRLILSHQRFDLGRGRQELDLDRVPGHDPDVGTAASKPVREQCGVG